MKKLNWGIIGLGAIAQKFSEAFAQTSNSLLLAVASNNPQKLESFKKQFFIEDKFAFKNYEDLINCKEVDIVYIALPNSFHFYWIKECIKNNKNTLVEKPATLNFTAAKSGGSAARGHPRGGDYSRNHQARSAPGSGGANGWFRSYLGPEGKHGMVVVWEFK